MREVKKLRTIKGLENFMRLRHFVIEFDNEHDYDYGNGGGDLTRDDYNAWIDLFETVDWFDSEYRRRFNTLVQRMFYRSMNVEEAKDPCKLMSKLWDIDEIYTRLNFVLEDKHEVQFDNVAYIMTEDDVKVINEILDMIEEIDSYLDIVFKWYPEYAPCDEEEVIECEVVETVEQGTVECEVVECDEVVALEQESSKTLGYEDEVVNLDNFTEKCKVINIKEVSSVLYKCLHIGMKSCIRNSCKSRFQILFSCNEGLIPP